MAAAACAWQPLRTVGSHQIFMGARGADEDAELDQAVQSARERKKHVALQHGCCDAPDCDGHQLHASMTQLTCVISSCKS